jgi:hypothetical protein
MINKILALIICSLILGSCQKVINLDLNSADPKYVIEAELQEGTQDFKVKITQTSNYFNNEAPTKITNAQVTLQKSNEAPLLLVNSNDGYYFATNYIGVSGELYKLNVTINGETFQARSFMPNAVILDSIEIEKLGKGPFGGNKEDEYRLFCIYKDPVLDVNFYKVNTLIDGMPNENADNLIVLDDRLTNGNKVRFPIFSDRFKLNDIVEVQLKSIDQDTYNFFNTLGTIVGGSSNGNAAPTNPSSNWSNGALGYFGATSVSVKKVQIK